MPMRKPIQSRRVGAHSGQRDIPERLDAGRNPAPAPGAATAAPGAGAKITGFLWQQGEAEAGLTDMSAKDYMSGFLEMLASIRAQGFSAPVYVAVSTICGDNRNAENIRRASGTGDGKRRYPSGAGYG